MLQKTANFDYIFIILRTLRRRVRAVLEQQLHELRGAAGRREEQRRLPVGGRRVGVRAAAEELLRQPRPDVPSRVNFKSQTKPTPPPPK